MKKSWKEYYKNTKDKPHSKYLEKALLLVDKKETALDLGAGGLMDSVFLASSGFEKIEAVDSEDAVLEIAEKLNESKIEVTVSSFEDFSFNENKYDLVHSRVSLPFVHPEYFDDVFKKVKNSVKGGGVLVVDFFGDRDGWSENKHMTFKNKNEIREMLNDMEIVEFEEEEKNTKTASGEPKHWHIFHVMAKKLKT